VEWNWQKTVLLASLFGLFLVRNASYSLEVSPEASAAIRICLIQAIVSLLFFLALIS